MCTACVRFRAMGRVGQIRNIGRDDEGPFFFFRDCARCAGSGVHPGEELAPMRAPEPVGRVER